MIFNSVIESIEKGKDGGNEGIPMGLDRFSQLIPNIQKGRYHLVVGESGSGKSAFVDTAYVFNPLEWYIKNKDNTDIKLKIFYYSLEISKNRLITKQISRKLYVDHGLLLDVNYILSFGKNRITEEHYQLVKKYRDYFYDLEEFLIIRDNDGGSLNPTGIRKDLLNHFEENGKFETVDKQLVYTENDPNLYTLSIVDHMALVPKERGYDTKQNIDKLSEYTIFLRNKCNLSSCYLVQANRNLGDIERLKMDGNNLSIRQGDIKDSSNPAQDSDAIIGIIDPWKYNLGSYRGYDISRLRGRQRFINLCKNRDGESEKSLGLFFAGECGFFKELPKPEDIEEKHYSYIERLQQR